MLLRRRTLLAGMAGSLALAGPALAQPAASAPSPTLHDACAARGILHGAAFDQTAEAPDPLLETLFKRECDLVIPENGGKWAVLQPADGRYDWTRMDRTVALARRIGARPVWHTVLWQHQSMPDYMKLPRSGPAARDTDDDGYFADAGTLSRANHWDRFTRHVDAVRARYGDVFHRIDVANEVFFWETAGSHPRAQDARGFRRGMWWHVAGGADGPDWLDPFFRYVRDRFPSAKLVINDFGVELAEGWQQRKRAYLLDWLTGARERGVPLDGLGLQSHLRAGKPYDRDGMRRFLRAVDALGLPVHITEFDVDERDLPRHWRREEKDKALAWTAREYLRDVLGNSRLVELSWWGLRADLSFITQESPGLDPRPLPYDRTGRPLPLYAAVVDTLQQAAL